VDIEAIKRAKDGLDVLDDIYRYAREGFAAIPDDDFERFKWYGLFRRKQTPGFFMMRLRMPNGILTSAQLAGIASIANTYGRGSIDITTRQNLQLRWIRIEDVPAIFAALDAIGIRHLQPGMDNIRNVTGCPAAGLDPNEVIDASALALAIQEGVIGRKDFSNLPRKFNISISGCRHDCALSQTHDLGLTPATRDGVMGFNVRVGGAMGGKSTHLSWDLDVFVEPHEVVALTRTILSIFRDEGSRENRLKARLKWLVEAWGVERFRTEIEARLEMPLRRAGRDEVWDYGGDHLGVHSQRRSDLSYVGLAVPAGRTTADDMIELARLAGCYGSGEVRLTNDQNVLIVNVPDDKLSGLLEEPLLATYSPDPGSFSRRMVSCTGKDFCHFSLIDTKGRATEIAESLQVLYPDETPLRMHWSGCPHACGLHHIADIGLQASRVRIGDEIVDAADVFVGGRLGKHASLATKVMDAVPLTELPQRLAPYIESLRQPVGITDIGEAAS
jgi:ferredoxin-nitrite reductase